ncbi:hypothetical protein BGZ51_007060 [Haplosporangium sp. Z 767]|nr:hypothetical protein BGZ51_007060 [Haplosporangium sp. Z 767]
MAPSVPGTNRWRTNTRGSSSSSTGAVRRESSSRRDARPTRTADKQDSDSESQKKGSPSRPKRQSKKAASQSKAQHVEQDDEGDDNGEEEDGDDVVSEDDPDEAERDLEENEGEVDEAGEKKITKDGELLGDRQYRCRSFKLPTRGDRIYMLSMDPARVLGFRDSYLFFLKNPQLIRVNTTIEERQWMIENGMLMANFKSKLIAVVTARSIFKSFGARIIKNGKSRVDDYYESNATDEDLLNESEGDGAFRTGDDHTGASSVNGRHQHAEDGALLRRKHTLVHEENMRHVTDLNWMYESAIAVRTLNAQLKELRKENPKFMDPHTNIEQVPTLLQPSRCEVQTAPQDVTKANSPGAGLDNPTTVSTPTATPTVLAVPRSIGPQVDLAVKVEIKAGAPPPPLIHDPNIWAAIPNDIRRILEDTEIMRMREDDKHQNLEKYPISILSGQYQATYPM